MEDLESANKVILLAEYTTAEGPMLDDHFIYVVYSNGADKSFPVEELDKPESKLKEIEEALGLTIECELCNRSDFFSRAIYPEQLSGVQVFQIVNEEKEKSLLKRFFSCLINKGCEVSFTGEVINLLCSKGVVDSDGFARPTF